MVAWKGSIVTATIANVNMVTDKMAMEKDAKDIDNFLKRCFSEPGFVGVTAATDGPDQVAVIYHFISKQ